MARRSKAAPEPFDRELADLPPNLRWREWMGRVEAAIFASPNPVPHAILSGLVGHTCSLDDVIADIQDELRARPYELVFVAGGWHHRTRPRAAAALALVVRHWLHQSPLIRRETKWRAAQAGLAMPSELPRFVLASVGCRDSPP